MMTAVFYVAAGIGFVCLFFIAVLLLLTVGAAVNDFFRQRFPAYDMWLYDDNRRWNQRTK